MILSITHDATSIQYIPRNIDAWRETLFVNGLGYGFHLSADGVGDFIERELTLKAAQTFPKTSQPSITTFAPLKSLDFTGRTLILTTSMKHIRELGGALKTRAEVVLLQGTSGGKSKMKHYFLEHSTSILIGLIDSWRDEADIFPYLDRVIIAKIPFDPPTDPYFLAKTNGMPHSFDHYSKPIVLSRLNTLIGDIHTKNPHTTIICSDERIHTTIWGNCMKENLF